MTLKEQLMTDLKAAMKSGNDFEVGLLRLLQSSLQNKEIEKRAKGNGEALSDGEVTAILQSEAKKRREATDLFQKGERPDLAEKEQQELAVIVRYLPAQLSRAEAETRVADILKQSGANDFPTAMKAVMGELKGKIDGKILSDILKQKLEGGDKK